VGEAGGGSGSKSGVGTNLLFTAALGLQSPWEVKSLEFTAHERRLDILVDFQQAPDLTARVPRCNCEEHGVKSVEVPWGARG